MILFSYEACLVLAGCILAFQTRSLDPKYGEAKQLGFTMYNIAFTGIIIITLLKLVDMDQESKIVIYSIGIIWGTVFSAFAFVLPRLLEAKEDKKRKKIHGHRRFTQAPDGRQVLVSGATNGAGSSYFRKDESSDLSFGMDTFSKLSEINTENAISAIPEEESSSEQSLAVVEPAPCDSDQAETIEEESTTVAGEEPTE